MASAPESSGNNRLRLLFVSRDPPGFGGAEQRLLEITTRLAARGHTVSVFCARTQPGIPYESTIDGVHYRFFSILPSWIFRFENFSFYLSRYLFYPHALLWGNYIRSLNPDVVIDYVMPSPTLIALFAQWLKIPCLADISEYRNWREWHEAAPRIMAVFGFIGQAIMFRKFSYRAIVTGSAATKRQLERHPHFMRHDVHIIPNAVDHQTFRTSDTSSQPSTNTLIIVGRLMKQKGHRYLIAALKIVAQAVPDVHLLIVGEGPLRGRLESDVRAAGLQSHVTFTGRVSEETKVTLYHRASIFVTPSVQEGFGIVLLEAMACGLPVIAFDLPVYHEILDQHCGTLVAKGDVDALAAQIIALLQDHDERQSIAAHNRRYVERFDWDSITDDMESLLQSVR